MKKYSIITLLMINVVVQAASAPERAVTPPRVPESQQALFARLERDRAAKYAAEKQRPSRRLTDDNNQPPVQPNFNF